jgi:hypothetical protein
VTSRRRYCTDTCRRELRRQLWLAEGLLRAMHTRAAAFRWTHTQLVMQLLPSGLEEFHLFIADRRPGASPSQGLSLLTEELGRVWWDSFRRTGSRHQATLSVLRCAQATGDQEVVGRLHREERTPAGLDRRHLSILRLSAGDLTEPNPLAVLKRAYRQSARRAHPDRGGTGMEFIRIKRAFDELAAWAASPSYRTRRRNGLPDLWVYDGERTGNCWSPPAR